jgi:hypothetical protein
MNHKPAWHLYKASRLSLYLYTPPLPVRVEQTDTHIKEDVKTWFGVSTPFVRLPFPLSTSLPSNSLVLSM